MATIDGFDTDLLGGGFERRIEQKVADSLGDCAVTILQFLFGTVAGGGVGGVGDLPVGAQTLIFVGDIVGRNANFQGKVDAGMDFRRDLLTLQLAHGFIQQTDVRVEAHGIDVAVLLAAQQVAGAAQFQV